jgi:hypothetical protein
VYSLSERVRSRRRRSRRGAFRVAFAGALRAAMLAALASVGGLGYAAGSAKSAWHVVTHKATSRDQSPRTRTPAAFEYSRRALVCHKGHTIVISVNAVPAHLRHGDTLGPCP